MIHSIGGFIFLYVACFIAAGGGIGGGGLNTPILLVILKFSYSESVLLSLATVAGNYIAQFLLNHNLRHPAAPSRPLIYWDVVLILLPAQLGGANIGALLLQVLPETLILIMALFVTVFALLGTFRKLVYHVQRENDSAAAAAAQINSTREIIGNSLGSTLLNDDHIDSTSAVSLGGYNEGVAGATKENCSTNIRMELPVVPIAVLAAVWLSYLGAYLVLKNYLHACTAAFFATLACIYVPLIGVIVWSVRCVSESQRTSRQSLLLGDISFKDIGVFPPLLAFGIGVLCSLLGIGGGELMGPMLLQLKVLPQVSSATTSIMSLLNTSLSIAHYVIAGGFPYSHASVCFAIGFAGGVSGRYFALVVTKVYKRASVTILLLCSILASSVALVIYDLGTSETSFAFRSMC